MAMVRLFSRSRQFSTEVRSSVPHLNCSCHYSLHTHQLYTTCTRQDESKRYCGATQRTHFTIRRPSFLAIKGKARLETMHFFLHDAAITGTQVVDDNEIFYNWRTVVQLKEIHKKDDIPSIFGRSLKLPNICGVCKPLELIKDDDKLFIVYDHCSSTTLSDYIKVRFGDFVSKGVFLLSPAAFLIRMLVQVALILEKYKLNYSLNEKLMFVHEEFGSLQIVLDVVGDKNNYDVIADVVEAHFGKARESYELGELLHMLRNKMVNDITCLDAITATNSVQSITGHLVALAEELGTNCEFRRKFDLTHKHFLGWKRILVVRNCSNTPSSLIIYFRNACVRKINNKFSLWEPRDVIGHFRQRFPTIIYDIVHASAGS